jgi:flagella basal body P-ring formation protein FlgA
MRNLSVVRQTVLGMLVVFGLLGMLVYPHTAAAIGLKENSIVESNTITLGDIFTGLPKDSNKIMGISPQPGHEMVLDSRTLLRIALSMDLPWRPATDADSVVLKRAATIVPKDTIDQALRAGLTENGVTGSYKLILSGEAQNMILPPHTEPAVEVMSMDVKPEKNWFQATLAAPSVSNPLAKTRISGQIEYMTKVPVLRENLDVGSIIGANDIDYIEIPQKNLKTNIVLNEKDLIGMAPRRVALAGQMINNNDLESPRLVARGDIITMVFAEGPMQLTAQGKALEHGAKGDRIRVMNTASNKTIIGEVTNSKEITLSQF